MMKPRKEIVSTVLLSLALTTGGAVAQQQDKAKGRPPVIIQQGGAGAGGFMPGAPVGVVSGQGEGTFVFVASEMSLDSKVVKGAPYSAQAITENIQTLADGNRIVQKSTATVYRDSEGRTRREQTLNAIGPYASAGEPPQTIVINDPVANVSYILDPKSRTARKHQIIFTVTATRDGSEPAAAARTFEFETRQNVIKSHKGEGASVVVGSAAPPQHIFRYDHVATEAKTEQLGTQNIEGVMAEGTRTTAIIPAGAIGNEQPIHIVTERWYSPELQTVVMSRHSDPRFGENIYRLTNINRVEPAPSLFELPGDYEVKESVPMKLHMQLEQELKRARQGQEKSNEEM